MSIFRSRAAAVVAGAATVVALGATTAVAGDLIGTREVKDNSLRSADVRDGSLKVEDFTERAEAKLTKAGPRGPKGEPGEAASDVFGELAASAESDPVARTTIDYLGGTIRNTGRGVTPVTSIDLEAGTYLISAYGHFDRVGSGEAGYTAPTTDTYGALALWKGDQAFTEFANAAGTYFTGNISPAGYVEATASGSQVLTLTEATTLHVGAFGYNEDRGSFGSADHASGAQFTVYAKVSAVKVG